VANPIVIDTGPLGRLAHPRPNRDAVEWLGRLARGGLTVIVPEIADYELRRNLLVEGFAESLVRLDRLKTTLVYLPLNTDAMLHAAQLWAEARRGGQPTAAPDSLDGDVILASQALQVGGIVATDNVRHLGRFVDARRWNEITVL
jgi:predicted nucleic acid-binding protein